MLLPPPPPPPPRARAARAPPRARPSRAPPRSAQSCPPPQCRGGGAPAPPPAAASSPPLGDSQTPSPREPRPVKAKGGEGSRDLVPSFPGVACSAELSLQACKMSSRNTTASLRTTLGSQGQWFQSVIGRVVSRFFVSQLKLVHWTPWWKKKVTDLVLQTQQQVHLETFQKKLR